MSDQIQLGLDTGTSRWTYEDPPASLAREKVLAIDLETYDPNLLERGPGSMRRDGYVCGISIANAERGWYIPVRHKGPNVPVEKARKILRALFKVPKIFTGANTHAYDLEWLVQDDWLDREDIKRHRWEDTQLLEPLIDEDRPGGYSLEELGRSYLGCGKIDVSQDIKRNMCDFPATTVAEYAIRDAHMCMEIRSKQIERIGEENLGRVMDLEVGLVPLILEMRLNGVPVDVEGARRESAKLLEQEKELHARIKKLTGHDVDEWSAESVARALTKAGVLVPRTRKDNLSITADFLEDQVNEEAKIIGKLRKINRLRNFFLDEYILGNQINGRIHCQFHQLRRDDTGTRSGRFSSSGPNLQQAPKRDEELAPLVRGQFMADIGKRWGQWDYSQQEPRTLVHYAEKRGFTDAEKMGKFYRESRKADFYKYVMAAAEVERFPAKTISLGRFYGMGKKKLAAQLGIDINKAGEILRRYDTHVPFVHELSSDCQAVAKKRGYICTILGRRRRFNTWAPIGEWGIDPLPLEQARAKWPESGLERAGTHKALNSLIQGSAADMTKMAMLRLYQDLGYVPYLTVHDEIDGPVEDMEEARKIQDIMEHAVELTVPLVAEPEVKERWA